MEEFVFNLFVRGDVKSIHVLIIIEFYDCQSEKKWPDTGIYSKTVTL